MSVFDFFRQFFIGKSGYSVNPSEYIFNNDDDDDNDPDSPKWNDVDFFGFKEIKEFRDFVKEMESLHALMFESLHSADKSMMEIFTPTVDLFRPTDPTQSFNETLGIEDHGSSHDESPESLRKQLVKPDFRNNGNEKDQGPANKVDTILDGKVGTSDILRAFDKEDSVVPIWSPNDSEKLLPFKEGSSYFTSKSKMIRTVQRPDGTIEREEIVRNSDGTETKTVTRRIGDRECILKTFKDASGKERCEESCRNIEAGDLQDFRRDLFTQRRNWWSWWDGDDNKPVF